MCNIYTIYMSMSYNYKILSIALHNNIIQFSNFINSSIIMQVQAACMHMIMQYYIVCSWPCNPICIIDKYIIILLLLYYSTMHMVYHIISSVQSTCGNDRGNSKVHVQSDMIVHCIYPSHCFWNHCAKPCTIIITCALIDGNRCHILIACSQSISMSNYTNSYWYNYSSV